MTRRHAAVLAVLAVGLAGCGSSSSSSSSGPAPAAYRASANKICATLNANITALPKSTASTIAGLDKLLAAGEATLAQLKAITPPSSISARVGSWLGLVTQSGTSASKLVAAAKSGNKSQIQQLSATTATLDSQTNAAARSLGLPDCAVSAQPSG
jgi:hypothetical protein